MQRKLLFTPTADRQLASLENDPARAAILNQVQKALGYLETNPQHPGLHTHEFVSLPGAGQQRLFEAYDKTPGAYRIFWHYGPDEGSAKNRISAIIAITPHP